MANKKDKETKSAHEKIQESRKAIVDKVVELLESGKKLDWSMGWNGTNLNPHNPVSGAKYQGANRLRLAFAAIINEYQDPRWCTFAQARAQDWQIKKGAKGVLCESFIFEREVKDLDENGKEKRDENGNIVYKKEKLEKPIRTTFTVFNASQIHGIPQLEMPESPSTDFQLGVAKVFIDSSDCPISYAAQKRAFYAPGLDRIFVPPKEFFKDEESFFATVTHEMGHSTGHKSRLDRDMKGSYGSKSYAKEELVAELCSMFTQSNLNIELKGEHFENHAAYLQSWISILKDDPNELFIAAEKASKAADYLYERYMEYNNERLKSHGIDIEAEKAKENESSAMQIDLVDEKTNDLVKDGALANSDKVSITPKDLGVPLDGKNGSAILYNNGDEILNSAMQERGYKHNIWVTKDDVEELGGTIKDGQEPAVTIKNMIKGHNDYFFYNIDQTEGCDLNLGTKSNKERSNPQIQAYVQEHAEELKNIRPNGLPIKPCFAKGASLIIDDTNAISAFQKVLKDKGYKHNIWLIEKQIALYGGKIKDGETPYPVQNTKLRFYNIEQTEGVDLSVSDARTHPQIQAYIKEHPLELNHNLPIDVYHGVLDVEFKNRKLHPTSLYPADPNIFEKVKSEKGYKYNMWLSTSPNKHFIDQIQALGGKIKEGELPSLEIENIKYYNIEQTEGLDLNKSWLTDSPYIQAYLKEKTMEKSAENTQTAPEKSQTELKFVVGENNNQRAVNRAAQAYKKINERINQQELLKANGLGDPIFAYSGIVNDDPRESKILNDTMLMRAYKYNLWGSFDAFERLGGKIKDGEEPLYAVDDLGDDGQGVYNIEQFEGVDLNLSAEPTNPQIQAYIQEHADELKTIHPNGLPITPFNHIVDTIDSPNFNDLQQVLQEKGYKHNIWIHTEDLERLGGNIKDGEELAHYDPYFNHYYYNIEQTEGIDLNLSDASTHPQVQAYLKEKALENLGVPIYADSGLAEVDAPAIKKFNELMQERGYKHNLWLMTDEPKYLGGKIKDGEKPINDILNIGVYNIEQCEGVDLNLSDDSSHPQIQAYIQEHADELKNIHPNGLPIRCWNYMACKIDSPNFNKFQQVLQEKGYKHNIWVDEKDVERLGGKVKEGESRLVRGLYNIEQTEGVDLTITDSRNNPQTQAYIKEHPVEMNPNLPILAASGTLLKYRDPDDRALQPHVKAMEKHGYKHNLWLLESDVLDLGGKLKDGEQPVISTIYADFYNIEQTEGVDLNKPELRNSPYIQTYLKEKALEALGEPIFAYSGLVEDEKTIAKKVNEAMQEHGYKHNIWGRLDEFEELGGKLKDDQEPIMRLDFKYAPNQAVYNIEQFEGVDLNLSVEPTNPQIQAYIQEHADELKNIHPNGLPIDISFNTVLFNTDSSDFKNLMQVFQEKGYKHNIWLDKNDVELHGGKIKDGEQPLVAKSLYGPEGLVPKSYYNIEQTEGVDLTLTVARNNAHVQAYMKEHPVEINPKLPIDAYNGTLMEEREPNRGEFYVKAMEEHGYKHNLWVTKNQAAQLGGKIKDGEQPLVNRTYYNIEQCEGVDLNKPELTSSPYIQAYLKDKALEALGKPILAYCGLVEDEETIAKKFNQAMQERGYKHNLWGGLYSFERLGGKLKDGEEPIRDPYDESDPDKGLYNIEQFEGVDLNLSSNSYHPQIQAYIQEHAEELKNIHPNGLPITTINSLVFDTDSSNFKNLMQVFQEKGYKHNIWVDQYDVERLGGAIKDGEKPSVKIKDYSFYNIEQTEGVDLTLTFSRNNPQVQAYMKEHPVEMDTNIPIKAYAGTLLEFDSNKRRELCVKAMEEHGYKHNIWLTADHTEYLGGKIKDGQEPFVTIKEVFFEYSYYNIDQTEGVDLNQPKLTSSPYIQAYLKEKALENLGDPVYAYSGVVIDDPRESKILKETMLENGYKHNIWASLDKFELLGGRVKDGEKPLYEVDDLHGGDEGQGVYNIEQFEGVDLNLSFDRANPQIQAYIQEHADELKTVHPNGLPITPFNQMVDAIDSRSFIELQQVLQEKGYKHNIWINAEDLQRFSGKVKDGEEPVHYDQVFYYPHYNIEQTEGVDLNLTHCRDNPQVQAYLKEKALEALGDPIYAFSGLTEDTPYFVEKMKEAMLDKGYKHNIWSGLDSFASLGGKLKDGEQPLRILNDDVDRSLYNIEQFEGVDLTLSNSRDNPQIQAYIQEHADELKTIHPNGLPIDAISGLAIDAHLRDIENVMTERGFKHNIWLNSRIFSDFVGGKIKDGERPCVVVDGYSYYNIGQSEGCDLNFASGRIHPQIQAYIKENPINVDPNIPIGACTGSIFIHNTPNVLNKAMQKHGYKHNLWVCVGGVHRENEVEDLGGKLKDGEKPAYTHSVLGEIYNIEQTEGCDLKKHWAETWSVSHPYIDAYLDAQKQQDHSRSANEILSTQTPDHPVADRGVPSANQEGVTLNSNSFAQPKQKVGDATMAQENKGNQVPINGLSGRQYTKGNFTTLEKAYHVKGHSNNIWVTENQAAQLGGKVKEGEVGVPIKVPHFEKGKGFTCTNAIVYNLDQTIDCNLNLSKNPNHPQIQAYIQSHQQTLTQTQQQPQQANPVLSDELTQSQGNISPASIKAVQQQSNQFVTDAVKNRADQMKTKEAHEQDAGMSYLDEQGTKKAPPRAKPRSKEPRNKDPER